MRTFFVLALLCLAGGAVPAQVIQTESRTVLVDAVVTSKAGEYVHDLTAKDFRIWQDGKQQAITSVAIEAKSTEPHFLVLFFDDTRMAAQDQFLARQAASRFIDANAGPRRLMAVVSYNGALRIAQNFTDDAGRLKDALNRVESSSSVTSASSLERPSAGAPTAADNFESRNMLQSLGNLTRGLGVLPGRKTVVLLTGGLSSTADQKSAITAAIEASSRSGVAIYPVNVRPISVEIDPSAANPQTRVVGRGARGLQGADDSPRIPDPSATSQQFLLALASGTGGFLIPDSSDLLRGLQRIGEEQTESYVLSYTPPASKDASCHTLRVKVDRPGATLRARSSYCATKPLDLIAGTAAAKDLESRAAGEEAGNLRASIQLPYFYSGAAPERSSSGPESAGRPAETGSVTPFLESSPGVARVHLAAEIAIGALKFENQKGPKLHAEINILGVASTSDGGVGARFSDVLKLDFDSPAEFEKQKGTPVHYEKEFKIAPGKYAFALAFGSGGASFGKIDAPLVVEPWNPAELTLSGVALSRETHPAADIGLVSSLVEDRKPLVAEGTQFVPFGSNQFAKSEQGFFYLEIYDPDPASVRVRVRVLDRKNGAPKWDSGLTKPPLPDNGGKPSIPAGAGLGLNSLAIGAYQLEITASDSAGKEVERTVDFEVR
jgi:VWFA-related protein